LQAGKQQPANMCLLPANNAHFLQLANIDIFYIK